MQPRQFPDAHIAYLRTLAAYAIDPCAPQTCRDAKAELERIESAQADREGRVETIGDLPAAEHQREMF